MEVKILSSNDLIIPEYKIDLLNKSKKIINIVENTNPIIQIKKIKSNNTKKRKKILKLKKR